MIPSNRAILDYKSIERTSHSNQSSHVVMEEETDTKKVGVKTKKNSSEAPGAKRKRTAEEVEENRRIAQVINRIFAYCKGGNFNIHIWAWFGYFIY